MRLTAQRTLADPKGLSGGTPNDLRARVQELAGFIDEVTDILRDMGAEESSIQVTLMTGYRYGSVQGTGEKADRE